MQKLFISVLLTLASGAFAADRDPDEVIELLRQSLKMVSTLQPDKRATGLRPRYWQIDLKDETIEGSTDDEIKESWKKYSAEKHKFFLQELANYAPDLIEGFHGEYVTDELVEQVNAETDATIEFRSAKGERSEEIVTWFYNQVLTRAGQDRVKDEFEEEYGAPEKDRKAAALKALKTLEWTHFHVDDSSAELSAIDVIIIRGKSSILYIEIPYGSA